MEKRTIIAVVLSLLVLILFQIFYSPDNITPTKDTINNKTNKNNTNAYEPETKKIARPTKTYEIKQADLLHINNKHLRLAINKETGFINSIEIFSYKDKLVEPVVFKSKYKDYISHNNFGTPSIENITKAKNITSIDLIYKNSNILIKRTYSIKNNDFIIKVEDSIINNSNITKKLDYNINVGPGLGEGFDESKFIFSGLIAYNGKKLFKEKEDDIEDNIEITNPLWFGFTSKYFLLSIIDGTYNKAVMDKYKDSAILEAKKIIDINPNSQKNIKYKIYVGPKEYNLLKSLGLNLEKSVDFGIFFFLAIPFLQVLIYFNNIFNNYGVAIILLTLILKLLTLPLNSMSMKSMKKMQKVQPEITKVRNKYKGDPQKMNAAVMELYRKHKVNPMSSCLPLLIQIPIFIALYRMLLVSIELKNSPFIWWITDLSQKDPLYITPILMGLSMFAQQKMTPSTADPTQQKIFMLMPIIFTFLFINFPSGLVIYWLVNNILTIIHQMYLNKKLE
ncbi:MAG: membrane protein insertase YidC [Deferribacterota bacterium]|nr:membrane protein insertase YidC [Deferribacterota bacterium]